MLEVGVGSGLNLPFYAPGTACLIAIDPSLELLQLATKRRLAARTPISLLPASAEQLPFANAVFDTVVMTWTLCSIAHPVAALREMSRVLKPGGRVRLRCDRNRLHERPEALDLHVSGFREEVAIEGAG